MTYNDLITYFCEINANSRLYQLKENDYDNIPMELMSINLFNYPLKYENKFANESFKNSRDETSLSIKERGHFHHEMKIYVILAFYSGFKEGGRTIGWGSMSLHVSMLRKLAEYLNERGYNSFLDLKSLNILKRFNLINDFAISLVQKSNRYASVCNNALRNIFGMLDLDYPTEINRYLRNVANKQDEKEKTSHALVPPLMMKMATQEARWFFDNNTLYMEELVALNNKFINVLCDNAITHNTYFYLLEVCYTKEERNRIKKLKRILEPVMSYVYYVQLAYTGMRQSEGLNTELLMPKAINNKGEKTRYSVETILNKYTDQPLKLDWSTSKLVHDSIAFVVKLNQSEMNKAKAILEHRPNLSDKTESWYKNLREGVESNALYSIRMKESEPFSIRFTIPRVGKGKRTINLRDTFSYTVTQEDIDFLETYGCNYKTISGSSKVAKRGEEWTVGDRYFFTPHMLRHTFAWFVIANKLGDVSDIKQQYKHLSESVSFVYARRGLEAIDETITLIENMEAILNEKSIIDIIESASKGQIAGGGGKRLSRVIKRLNDNQSKQEMIFSTDHQQHFETAGEMVAFVMKNSDGIRGLPHGYCTAGTACKIKNVANPSHCFACDTYYATPKHLPYWKLIEKNSKMQINRIEMSCLGSRYGAFLKSAKNNLITAISMITEIEGRQEVENVNV
ncbi:hypothetical protein FQP88_12235 [Vibrio atlanticus]|nr:hypothetical protein FQP88_12235 [Vibrio atlanticus]